MNPDGTGTWLKPCNLLVAWMCLRVGSIKNDSSLRSLWGDWDSFIILLIDFYLFWTVLSANEQLRGGKCHLFVHHVTHLQYLFQRNLKERICRWGHHAVMYVGWVIVPPDFFALLSQPSIDIEHVLPFSHGVKSLRHLKAYSRMSNWGRSENFQNLNVLHVFVALL